MKVKHLMERAGIQETGRGLMYIKDALEELNMLSETHVTTKRETIVADKRFYKFPLNMVQWKSVRVKNHLNSKDEYRDIPRLVYEPTIVDGDDI